MLDCLRREVDGRPMKDRRVHVTLRGVAAVAASYDTLHLQHLTPTMHSVEAALPLPWWHIGTLNPRTEELWQIGEPMVALLALTQEPSP